MSMRKLSVLNPLLSNIFSVEALRETKEIMIIIAIVFAPNII